MVHTRCTILLIRLRMPIEHITHSICTLEFEDHRPLYDWVVRECEFENPPRQIEFAKMYLTNVITGKRYIKKLVEDKIVDGWDDPRLVTIAALRRRGYTPESIRRFVELAGVSKADNSIDSAMLEYCLREDLKLKKSRVMAILDPVQACYRQLSGRTDRGAGCTKQYGERGTWFQKDSIWQRTLHRTRGLYGRTTEEILPSLPGQ